MHTGKGQIVELILQNGLRQARISCPENLIPSAGQYLLASGASSADILPVPVFYTDSAPQGFITSTPVPDSWTLGRELSLHGPLGRGFKLPASARKVALIAFDDSPSRLHGLIKPALTQSAAVVLVCDTVEEYALPDEVEIHPLSAWSEIVEWADYVAFDVAREHWFELRELLLNDGQLSALPEAQILIRTPVPCGGIADCGVCAVTLRSNWKLACKDGPVFNLNEI